MAFSPREVPAEVATAYELFWKAELAANAYARQPYSVTPMGTGSPIIDSRGMLQFTERGPWNMYKVFTNKDGQPAEAFINANPVTGEAVILPKNMDFPARYLRPYSGEPGGVVVPLESLVRSLSDRQVTEAVERKRARGRKDFVTEEEGVLSEQVQRRMREGGGPSYLRPRVARRIRRRRGRGPGRGWHRQPRRHGRAARKGWRRRRRR